MRLVMWLVRAGERSSFPSLSRAIEKPTPTAFRSTLLGYTPARPHATTLVMMPVKFIAVFSRGARKFLSRFAISR